MGLTVAAEPVSSPAAQALLTAYSDELDVRFPGVLDREVRAADDAGLAPPYGLFLVVRSTGRAVGCGGVRAIGPAVGEVKRMYVEPGARGLGAGRLLLAALEEGARGLGHRTMRLDTRAGLAEARRLYTAAGYHEVARYNDNRYAEHFYGKQI